MTPYGALGLRCAATQGWVVVVVAADDAVRRLLAAMCRHLREVARAVVPPTDNQFADSSHQVGE